MNELVKKILERLEEKRELHERLISYEHNCGTVTEEYQHRKAVDVLDYAKEIVQKVAEEYKDGWVPCSKKLPEDDSVCIVTVKYPNNKTMVDYGWFDRKSVCWFVGMQEFRTSNILAWQPLPEPFKERD